MNISVCLVTRNAEPTLARCLQSVRPVADEIIIIDAGSTDRTPFIATDFNARFIRSDAGGDRLLALQKATRDTVLFLNPDDELSAELQQELINLKKQPPGAAGYLVNTVRNIAGQPIRFGKNYPAPRLLLARKTVAALDANNNLTVPGETVTLAGELIRHVPGDLQNPPPYNFLAAVINYLFKGGITRGALGWQIARLDAAQH